MAAQLETAPTGFLHNMSENGACVNSIYCDLIKSIKRLRKKHRFGTIEMQIRDHKVVHADIKVTQNLRVALQDSMHRPRN